MSLLKRDGIMEKSRESDILKENKGSLYMAYWCRKCRRWHYPQGDVSGRHKIYAGTPQRKKKKGFIDWIFD